MLEWIIALLTLTFLEIVLGIDNIIFVSIVTNKLPDSQKKKGRALGLALALVFRILLLVSLTWMVKNLTTVLFTVFGSGFSVREIILLLGGLFLLGKSTHEIHLKMEQTSGEDNAAVKTAGFTGVIVQIALLDIVFSFDSILTAIGLTDRLPVMITAVVIAMIIMLVFSGRVADFIHRNPTLEILALSFLILIGFMLVLEGFHYEIPKGYIYFAVFFSLCVEVLNMRLRKKRAHVELGG
ncbi:MAG TPA: TerC family protein [Spirochaetota bacterium]|nr:TerC family protein [Spirochaetota bacterium]HRZ27624.1 TerC family protein [Spirochaetota bacterium]HSA13508.1 TerC family protein [Spirochaetota bacterium]